MQTRSKVVDLSGNKFHVRRLPPEVGSFILMRMIGVRMRSADAAPVAQKAESEQAAPPVASEKINGEMQVRALAFSVFSGGVSFDDFKFIQNSCMKVVSIVKEHAGNEFPMPIVTDEGVWTADGAPVAENVGLIMQLTTEVLIFCFADFFDTSGTGA
jgi:hypothetical protein